MMDKSFATPFILDGKVYLDKKDVACIGATPPNDCWICDQIYSEIRVEIPHQLYFLYLKWLEDEGFVEHLKQLIGDFNIPKPKDWRIA